MQETLTFGVATLKWFREDQQQHQYHIPVDLDLMESAAHFDPNALNMNLTDTKSAVSLTSPQQSQKSASTSSHFCFCQANVEEARKKKTLAMEELSRSYCFLLLLTSKNSANPAKERVYFEVLKCSLCKSLQCAFYPSGVRARMIPYDICQSPNEKSLQHIYDFVIKTVLATFSSYSKPEIVTLEFNRLFRSQLFAHCEGRDAETPSHAKHNNTERFKNLSDSCLPKPDIRSKSTPTYAFPQGHQKPTEAANKSITSHRKSIMLMGGTGKSHQRRGGPSLDSKRHSSVDRHHKSFLLMGDDQETGDHIFDTISDEHLFHSGGGNKKQGRKKSTGNGFRALHFGPRSDTNHRANAAGDLVAHHTTELKEPPSTLQQQEEGNGEAVAENDVQQQPVAASIHPGGQSQR
ncbi:hypothetical protein HK102_006737 [Quaeritorhiza haematococci]|nr:hypothetical protein HK102_006737 [Quaeritorhiza haematococci]